MEARIFIARKWRQYKVVDIPQPQVQQVPIDKLQKFEDFFRYFEDTPGVSKYLNRINEIHSKGEDTLIFLFEDLLKQDNSLADLLEADPEGMLDFAHEAFLNLLKFHEVIPRERERDYFVRVTTKDEKSNLFHALRDLRSKHNGRLLWLRGIVIRTSDLKVRLIDATFRCNLCGAEIRILQLGRKMVYPKRCAKEKCRAKNNSDFQFIPKDSKFTDYQGITIQECPEDLPPGMMPRSISCNLTDSLVDRVKPGDRVRIMGDKRLLITSKENSNLMTSYIHVNNLELEGLDAEEHSEFTPKDVAEILELAKEPGIQRKICLSLAPFIYGKEHMKMACALSLFSGPKRNPLERESIHVLLVGDPGLGKSVIIKDAVRLAPRGVYTSGKGSSAVGLTATVIRDPDTDQWTLEAGVMVLANGGVAGIDEFDKMETNDRSAIHEVLEQQTVSIAKAGIVATLKAETAVIAAANPHSGRYDTYKTPTQNIKFPASLLSRFDLIFVDVDKPNAAEDAQIAEFILNRDINALSRPITEVLLRKYIQYAKKYCNPQLTEEAKERIKAFYLMLRSSYDAQDAIVSIFARHVDGLKRLGKAYAKMALRDQVTLSDINEILKIYEKFLKDTGYDETTGKIDMDRIFVGQSRSQINKLDKLLNRLREIFEECKGKPLERDAVIQILSIDEEGLDKKYITGALEELVHDGTLYEPKTGFIKFTKKE